jgi:phage gpG-like protein
VIRASLKGDLSGIERLRTRLLDKGTRQRLLKQLGNQVVKASRQRIAKQMGLEAPFAPRAHREVKRKLLARLGRYLMATVRGDQVIVSFRNGLTGAIARAQQEGSTETVTAASLIQEARRQVAVQERREQRRRKGSHKATGVPGDQATTAQAKRMQELGFKKSLAWLKQRFTREAAGYIIRKMEHRAPKSSWTITVPARPFLGATAADRKDLLDIVRSALAGK